jgi:hypothetical protein
MNDTRSKLEKSDYEDRISAFFLLRTPTIITAIPIEMMMMSPGIKMAATWLTIPKTTNMMPKIVRDIPAIISPFKPFPTMLIINDTYQ